MTRNARFPLLLCLIIASFLACTETGQTTNEQKSTKNPVENKAATTQKAESENNKTFTKSKKALNKEHPVVNIKPGSKVASPISIKVNSMGLWFGFEGTLGTVALVDNNGKKLGMCILGTSENWMQKGSVNYECELAYSAAESGEGQLIFTNSNPSGLVEHEKTFAIDVVYGGK